MDSDDNQGAFLSPARDARTMERNHLVLLACASLAASSLLLIAAVVNQERPLEVAPGKVDGVEVGTLVAVEGVVAEGGIRRLDGCALVTLVGAGGGSARAFLAFDPDDLGPGDTVRVVGTVQLYKGSVEVLVPSEGELEVISKEPRPWASLEELVGEPWRYRTVQPRTCVTVASTPVPAGPEGGSWCVVRSGDAGPSVAAFLPGGMDAAGWEEGARLELCVRVRHDADRGLVYLEVVGWTGTRDA